MFSKSLTTKLQRLILRISKYISFKEYIDKAIKISNDLYRINLNSRTRDGLTRYAYRFYYQNYQNSARTPLLLENIDQKSMKVNKVSAKNQRLNNNQIKYYSCGKKRYIARYYNKSARARSTKVSRVAQRESLPAYKYYAKAENNSNLEELEKKQLQTRVLVQSL